MARPRKSEPSQDLGAPASFPAGASPPRRLLILRLAGAGIAALPFLGRLRGQGAWLAWADAGPEAAEPWNPSLLAPALGRPGLRLGLFNLPLPSPLPPGTLFAVPEPGPEMTGRVHPPELATDLGDYLTGAAWTLGRPQPRPHERDPALSQQAAFARLVFEHARRLAREHGPDLLAVDLACAGLGGLEQVRALNEPASGRELLLRQLDGYAGGLAQAAGAVICLAGGLGALLWCPGLICPGWSGQAPASLLPALISALLGLDSPAALHGTIPSGMLDPATN